MAGPGGKDDDGASCGLIWLSCYIFINLSTTLMNKAIFIEWGYPTCLALWHYTVTSFGSNLIVRVLRLVEPAKLDWNAHLKIMAFSVLFNVNIWVSNVTLDMVSMALHQVVRALVPACTVLISFTLLGKRYGTNILMSLVVIFMGVAVYAAKGEVNYSYLGLGLTLVGTMLAALKGVLTNMFMVGDLKLHPLDLLTYTTTYSAIQLLMVLGHSGQLSIALEELKSMEDYDRMVKILIVNGCFAFLLNVVSFNANKATSPLALNIGGITKQILAIVLGIVVFKTPIRRETVIGVGITISGITMYARESYKAKMTNQAKLSHQSSSKSLAAKAAMLKMSPGMARKDASTNA